ncbi:MAG: FMN-binding protein [Candidatus Izimaplasma sp.]|nr:FMN-binding protein [Candidatus Izimaplasma bacterium]
MFDKLKTALVLVIIAGVSGFLIYNVNELTKDKIEANKTSREEAYYAEIFDTKDKIKYTKTALDDVLIQEEIEITDTSGNVIGYIYKGTHSNNYGDITVLIGITIDDLISNVIISSTTNTPTFVQKLKDNNLANFSGQQIGSVTYDSKTGATYSYTSVSQIVDSATQYYSENRGEMND